MSARLLPAFISNLYANGRADACVSFTLCLSENYGLRAYMGGKYYGVDLAEPLCDVVGDTMPIVEKELIYRYFYADRHSGRATIRAG